MDIPLSQRTEFLPICQRHRRTRRDRLGCFRKGCGKRDVPLQREGLEVVHNAKQPPAERSGLQGLRWVQRLRLGKHVRRGVRRDSAGDRHDRRFARLWNQRRDGWRVKQHQLYRRKFSRVRRRRECRDDVHFSGRSPHTYHPRVQWNLAKNAGHDIFRRDPGHQSRGRACRSMLCC